MTLSLGVEAAQMSETLHQECDNKNADSCYKLVYCFSRVSQNCKEEGINTFLDEVTASEYFKKACDLKSKQVCYELGLYYPKSRILCTQILKLI